MPFFAFLLLLGLALALRWLGMRLIPLAMPTRRYPAVGAGLAGGAVGGLFLVLGPKVVGLHIVGAALGAALALLLLGLAPFIKVLLGRA